jgi:LmbE family N-acetylglucosaminyl deacetylase
LGARPPNQERARNLLSRRQRASALGRRADAFAANGVPAEQIRANAQVPIEAIAGEIVAPIRRHRPQVVICDNQFGGYGHPDYIKLHRATVEAFSAAADGARYPEAGPPHRAERLYFTSISLGFVKHLVRLLPLFGRDPRRFGRNHDIDLLQILEWETPIHARIDIRRHYDVKRAASACHASQGGGVEGGNGALGWVIRRFMGWETYTQGEPPPAPDQRVKEDLFG